MSKAREKRQEEIFDKWYIEFKIAKLISNNKVGMEEYRLAREILDFALFNDTLTMTQSTLLFKIQKTTIS